MAQAGHVTNAIRLPITGVNSKSSTKPIELIRRHLLGFSPANENIWLPGQDRHSTSRNDVIAEAGPALGSR